MRPGIFVGYRMHSGGKWTGQYLVIDAEHYQERRDDQASRVHAQAASVIFCPAMPLTMGARLYHSQFLGALGGG